MMEEHRPAQYRGVYRTASNNVCRIDIHIVVDSELKENRFGVGFTWAREETEADVQEATNFVYEFAKTLTTGPIVSTERLTADSDEEAKRKLSAFLQFGDHRVGGQG